MTVPVPEWQRHLEDCLHFIEQVTPLPKCLVCDDAVLTDPDLDILVGVVHAYPSHPVTADHPAVAPPTTPPSNDTNSERCVP